MWTYVFASKRASECILLTLDKTACIERATWMIKQMKPYLSKLQSAKEGLDRNEVIQAYFNQVPAMISTQCKELGNVTSVDTVKILKLRGLDKKMYENIARPHGEDMIETKRAADNKRASEILRRAGAFD
jgi:rRNA-processing protein FCF1